MAPNNPSNAPERGPVPLSDIEAVRRIVPEKVRAAMDLQLLAGLRASEVCAMRPCDLDFEHEGTPEAGVYSMPSHAPGVRRSVYLGPKAQAVLKPLLVSAPLTRPLFPPLADYRRAILIACRQAGVTPFDPHQIRLTMAAMVTRSHGVETAAAFLGHAPAIPGKPLAFTSAGANYRLN